MTQPEQPPPALPRYDELPAAPEGGRSGWQALGAGDDLGRIGLQSQAAVRDAARLVRRGAMFPLNAAHDALTPPLFGRGALRHTHLGRARQLAYDDIYDNYYPQASSQWDSLAHVAYSKNVYYQGRTADEIAERHHNTIEHWATRGIAGRGVLLDLRRTFPDYDPGSSHAFTPGDLETAREAAGIEYRPGDVVLLHTGWFDWYDGQTAEAKAELAQPAALRACGIEHTEAMAAYLWDSGAAAFATDSPALEVWPPDSSAEGHPFGFLHKVLIGQLGLAIGELWHTADLAADCAADGVHEFLLTSAPVHVPGGVGSPANALAFK
jgi:kynurenine formamidase